jgi:glucose-specific phosphotransferase system IIA component
VSTDVLAPCAGRVIAMADVPDPVFAAEMVGPGVAIEPAPGRVTVTSPIAGKVVKVHPHAFVVLGGGGAGVLVHLGIDTNRLEGEGFEVHAQQGDQVDAGTPMVSWDPDAVAAKGLSTVVPVVLMDAPKGSVTSPVQGQQAQPGDVLFTAG